MAAAGLCGAPRGGAVEVPHMATPLVLPVALHDSWALSHLVEGYDGVVRDPVYSTEQLQYADRFGARVRHTLLELAKQSAPASAADPAASGVIRVSRVGRANAPSAQGGHRVVWGAACYKHAISDHADFLSLRAGSQTAAELLAAFLEGAPRRDWPASDLAECATFDCGGASCR